MTGGISTSKAPSTTPVGWLLLSLAATAEPAWAYLDPGAGSYIFQMIIAGLLGALYAIKVYWHKLLGLFRRGPAEAPDERQSGR